MEERILSISRKSRSGLEKIYFVIMDLGGREIRSLPDMSLGSIPNIWPNSMFLSTKGEKYLHILYGNILLKKKEVINTKSIR